MILKRNISFLFLLVFVSCIRDKLVTPISENGLNYEYGSLDRMEVCYQKLNKEGYWVIYASSGDDTHEKVIIENSFEDVYSPVWSPNGRQIAYRFDTGNNAIIRIYDVETDSTIFLGDSLQIFNEDIYPLLWLSNSELIICHYQKVGELAKIISINPNTMEIIHLTSDFIKVYPFDDGQKILVSNEANQIYSVDVETGQDKQYYLDLEQLELSDLIIFDFNGVETLIGCFKENSNYKLFKINIMTQEIECVFTTEPYWKLTKAWYSKDNDNFAFVEWNPSVDESKLRISYTSGNSQGFLICMHLTDSDMWFDFHPMEFDTDNKKVLFGVNTDIDTYSTDWYSTLLYYDVGDEKIWLISKDAIDGHWRF